MFDALLGFDWDLHNIQHIALHGVEPDEVEQTVRRPHRVFAAAPRGGEERWKLLGRTEDGRFLVVVFTIRQQRIRTVTAYTMNRTERRVYGEQIESPE